MIFTIRRIFRRFSRLEQLVFGGMAITTLLSGSLLSTSLLASATSVVPEYGGTYREGVIGQPIYLNPLLANGNDPDRDIITLVFSSVLDLAQKIEVSEDGRVWTIRIREDTFWQDGERLTSDDIIFTIKKIQDPETGSALRSSWSGIIPERKSELELTLTISAPYAFFEDNLKNIFVVPEHIWKNVPVANWRLSAYILEPIGSGPYAFDSYKKRRDGFITEYTLTRNEQYKKEKPYIKAIQFKFYQGVEEVINAFNLAHIDGFGGTNIPLTDIRRRHTASTLVTSRYYAVFLNQLTAETLKDVSVRNALDEAIDKERLVATVLNGNGAVMNGPIPPIMSGYDAEAVKRQEVGDSNTEGLSFDLVVPDTDFLVRTAERIQAAWQNIGVETNLVVLNSHDINTEVIQTRNYQMILFGNVLRGNPDPFSFWHSSQRFSPGLNLSLYENTTVDNLIETIRQTNDPEIRQQVLSKFQATIVRDMPAIFLFSPHYTYISGKLPYGPEVKRIVTPADRFTNITKWYIKTKRVLR